MSNTKWMVQRVEEHGAATYTVEMPEEEATGLYANWCSNIKRFNDQSVSLIRVDRTDTVVSWHANTEFKFI